MNRVLAPVVGVALFVIAASVPSFAQKPKEVVKTATAAQKTKTIGSERKYSLDVVCDTCPQLRITKVTVTDKVTIIDLTFHNVAMDGVNTIPWMNTGAPGDAAAFCIADPESIKTYKLLNVEGITVTPKQKPLEDGQTGNFRLTFERIPATLTKFHLLEGNGKAASNEQGAQSYWKFMNVKLKK